MNTTPRPQSRTQYPNGAHFQSQAGPQPAYQFAPHPAYAKAKAPWWERDGVVAKLFAAVGVFVTLIGVVMLLVIAARAGLLRPELRVGGGAALSAGLIGLAMWLKARPGGRVGAIALTATGTGGLFLCVVAATNFYDWIAPVVGLAIAALVAAGVVAVAMKWNSQFLASMMMAAVGVLAPVLTEGMTVELVAFLVLLQAAGCIPEFTKEWTSVAVARTLPVAGAATLAIALDPQQLQAQLASYLVATIGLSSALLASRRKTEAVTGGLYVIASIPMLIAVTALTRPIAAVAGVAIVVMTMGSVRLARPIGTGTTVAATLVSGASLLFATGTATSGVWLPSALLGLGLVMIASTYRVRNDAIAIMAGVFLGAGSMTELVAVLGADQWRLTWSSVVGGILMTAGILVAAAVCTRRYRFDAEVASVLAVLGLSVSTTIAVLSVSQVAAGSTDVGHLTLTVLWMAAAGAMLQYSLKVKNNAAVYVGLGLTIAGVALGKLFLHDLASLSGVVRAGVFIIVGLVLIGAGAAYAQAFARRSAAGRRQGQQPLAMR